MSLIDWKTKTATLKLKQYEIVTKPCPITLKEDGSNFMEWKDAVAKHCMNTGLISILTYGAAEPETPHEIHDLFAEEFTFFEVYGRITLDDMQSLAEARLSGEDDTLILKEDWLYSYVFGSVETNLQKKLSRNTSVHSRNGSTALKFIVGRVTESDRESVRLAENDLKALHISKDLHNVSTTISKIQDLLATLEANAIDTNKHISDVFDALSDDHLCEDFCLHLKIYKI